MVKALIIGQRKSGTTWLYENFKKEHLINVSEKVKESNFFSSEKLSIKEYHQLFSKKMGVSIEVDTSIISYPNAINRIKEYNPEMRIIIILREPVDYLFSRINHSYRKNELKYNSNMEIQEFFKENNWLLNEIELSHVERFKENFETLLIPYNDLKTDAGKVYNTIINFILSPKKVNAKPTIIEPINKGRQSRLPIITRFYTDFAKHLRQKGYHSIVNIFKESPIRKLIESRNPVELFSKNEINSYLKLYKK